MTTQSSGGVRSVSTTRPSRALAGVAISFQQSADFGWHSIVRFGLAATILGVAGLALAQQVADPIVDVDAPRFRTIVSRASPSSLQVGELAPDLIWKEPSGGQSRLADLRGRSVVLTFWASWCVPCRIEMPTLDRVARTYSTATIVAIDVAEDADTVASFVHLIGLATIDPVIDPGAFASRRYGVAGLPTTFFIDAGGTIREVVRGPLSEQRIAQGLGDPRSP